jgi:GNAT superfamily N-acetyltransferase
MAADILRAKSEADIRRCWPAFAQLRAHLSEAEFVARWRRQQPESYAVIYIEEEDTVAAAAGFRIMHTLSGGKTLYVDDLVTRETARRKGYAAKLLDGLKKEAAAQGCDLLHLDSGYQRHAAHKLYLAQGFEMTGHHFAWPVRKR